jgi:hypothetical protein
MSERKPVIATREQSRRERFGDTRLGDFEVAGRDRLHTPNERVGGEVLLGAHEGTACPHRVFPGEEQARSYATSHCQALLNAGSRLLRSVPVPFLQQFRDTACK